MSARHRFRTPAVAVLAAVIIIAAGCSDKKDSANGGAAPASSNPACTGAPLKLTGIASLTGPLSYPSLTAEAQHGQDAALRAGQQRVRARPSHPDHDV